MIPFFKTNQLKKECIVVTIPTVINNKGGGEKIAVMDSESVAIVILTSRQRSIKGNR